MNTVIYPGVQWHPDDSTIGPFVILGEPPRQTKPGERTLILGNQATIRSFTTIYAGSTLGHRLNTGHSVMIREDNQLGDDVSVGTSSVLEYGNKIGDRCRIHSGCFLEWVTLGHDVFVGPNVVFTDDPHPICPKYKECVGGPVIGAFTRIGANSTILPGVKIGEHCLIGAGSVVTQDVPDHSVVAGNPAKVIKQITELECKTGIYERPYIWLEE